MGRARCGNPADLVWLNCHFEKKEVDLKISNDKMKNKEHVKNKL